jgi:perosamine synthetase
MQAAIGVAQLHRVVEFVEKKRAIGRLYTELLNNIPNVKTQVELPWAKMVYWMYCIELDESAGCDANRMMAELSVRGVGTRPFFLGLHEQPILLDRGWYKCEHYPITERAARQGLYLPSSLNLTEAEIIHVVDQVSEILKNI